MLEVRGKKLFFGAKANFFVFIANLNSTSRMIFGIAPTCHSCQNIFQKNDVITSKYD